jgi:SAM-dependent methyltransferase
MRPGSLARRSMQGTKRRLRDIAGAVVAGRFRSLFKAFEPRPDGRRLADLMTRAQWSVDHIELTPDGVEMHGWAVARGLPATDAVFLVNGRQFDAVQYPLARDDIAGLFWYLPEARASGFNCRARTSLDDLFSQGFAEFRWAAREGASRDHAEALSHCCNYYADPRLDALPLPDPVRRRRVHGADLEGPFRIEGASAFVKLRRALQDTVGRDFPDFRRILDWGCGCGRSTRHFAALGDGRLLGVDIDADNIAWCSTHLPFGRFQVVPLHPPTALESAAFDLVLGVSVFTHLREAEQFRWLDELRRVAAPGAILLVTVHGDATVCRSSLSQSQFAELMTHGFLDAGLNPDLEGAIAESDYYRNSFQRTAYIRDRWSPYFEIVAVVPGYIGSFQDLVVLRRA